VTFSFSNPAIITPTASGLTWELWINFLIAGLSDVSKFIDFVN
jgi:hypothetical protein